MGVPLQEGLEGRIYLEGLLDASKGCRVSSLIWVVAPGGLAVRRPAQVQQVQRVGEAY